MSNINKIKNLILCFKTCISASISKSLKKKSRINKLVPVRVGNKFNGQFSKNFSECHKIVILKTIFNSRENMRRAKFIVIKSSVILFALSVPTVYCITSLHLYSLKSKCALTPVAENDNRLKQNQIM